MTKTERDLFILSDGPLQIVKVDQEQDYNKIHLKGVIEYGDEYHTMHELYEHRMALNIALFNCWSSINEMGDGAPEVMKSKLHSDGTMFDDYFIVMAVTPVGQISYHYKLKHWDKFKIPEVERTPKWDGHGSLQVIERLMRI